MIYVTLALVASIFSRVAGVYFTEDSGASASFVWQAVRWGFADAVPVYAGWLFAFAATKFCGSGARTSTWRFVSAVMQCLAITFGLILVIFSVVDFFFYYEIGSRLDSTSLSNLNTFAIGAIIGTRYTNYLVLALGAGMFFTTFLWFLIRSLSRSWSGATRSLSIESVFALSFPLGAVLWALPASSFEVERRTPTGVQIFEFVTSSAWDSSRTLLDFAVGKTRSSMDVLNLEERDVQATFSAAQLKWLESGCLEKKVHAVTNQRKFDVVVLVTIESLSKKFVTSLPELPEGKPIAPFLFGLSQTAPHLDNFWTTMIPTLPGLYATFLSRPMVDPIIAFRPQTETLFSVLERNGLKTAFVRGTTKSYGDDALRYPKWFKPGKFITIDDFPNFEPTTWGLSDKDLLEVTGDLLSDPGSGLSFVAVKTMDTHTPYRTEFESPPHISPGQHEFLAVYSFDQLLKGFVSRLETMDWGSRRVLLVITADHSKPGAVPIPRKIPLIFYSPTKTPIPPLAHSRPGSQLDLAPTVLALFGLMSPETFWGHDLFDVQCAGSSISAQGDRMTLRTPNETFSVRLKDNLLPQVNLDSAGIFSKWARRKLAIEKSKR